MPSALQHRVITIALMLGALVVMSTARADEVTIYRCVGAGNKISLQDRPCPKDVHQDVRQMLRPQDPPPRPQQVAATPAPRTNAVSDVIVHVVHDRDPQPTYQCTTSDGDSYISHTGIPRARYVPLWTFGFGRGDGFTNVGRPAPQPTERPGGSQRHHNGFGFPASVYVEDTCERLPQDEVCQSLRARNDALGTLIFNGQPSDRERYERERKGLLEQMRSDCNLNY